jgi:hypothetical protein
MREVNGELRMTIGELIEHLKQFPLDVEVSGMNKLTWWIENKKASEK